MIAEAVRLEFGHAIDRELSFLRSLGYRLCDVTEDSTKALGPRLSGGYTNAAVNRPACKAVSVSPGRQARELQSGWMTVVLKGPFIRYGRVP